MFRRVPTSDDAAVKLFQDIEDRLTRLESGGAIRGNISLSKEHRLYDVQVEVIDIGGGHREVRYTSPAGVTSTIATL